MNIEQIADFIRAHYEPSWHWPEKDLHGWLRWWAGEGFLICIKENERSDDLVGLVVARPVMNAYDGFDWLTFDHEGPCIFIDLAIATRREALTAIGFAVLHRYGERASIALRHGDDIRIHNAHNVRRALLTRRSTWEFRKKGT